MLLNTMEVFSGRMTVKAPSFFGTKIYENVWCVLHTNPNPDYVRMELYANENTKSGCKRYILFQQAKWKKTGMVDLAFGLELKGGKVYTFMVSSREDMKKWILYLCVVCKSLFDTKHEVGVDDKGKVDLDSFLIADNTVVQMNELYGSSSDARLNFFFVAIKPDSDCPKQKLSGLYKMILFEENIYLCELDSEDALLMWSLFEIKKYGFNSCFFYFIAGSKAEEREGNYAFYTAVGEKIKDLLLTEANKIREIYKDEIARNMAELGASASAEEIDIQIPSTSKSAVDSGTYSDVNENLKPTTSSKSNEGKKMSAEKKKSEKKQKEDKDKGDKKDRKKSKSENEIKRSDKKTTAKGATSANPEQTYSDPWENKLHVKPGQNHADNDRSLREDKDTYAEPSKVKNKNTVKSREVFHSENYEPAPANRPEIVPPKWEASHDDDSNNNSNTYAHIGAMAAVSHDNIYGMQSASAPLKPQVHHQMDNPYEDTNPSAGTYEAVNY